MYNYFVHFDYASSRLAAGALGEGNANIALDKPITCLADVRKIEESIEAAKQYDDVVVTHFQMFDNWDK